MNKQLSFWNEALTQSRKRKKKTFPLPKGYNHSPNSICLTLMKNTQLELPIPEIKKGRRESRIKKNKRLIPRGV